MYSKHQYMSQIREHQDGIVYGKKQRGHKKHVVSIIIIITIHFLSNLSKFCF